MKELARNNAFGIQHLYPGDVLIANFNDKEVGRYVIKEKMIVDTLVIVAPDEGELGLKSGIGAIFGKSL